MCTYFIQFQAPLQPATFVSIKSALKENGLKNVINPPAPL